MAVRSETFFRLPGSSPEPGPDTGTTAIQRPRSLEFSPIGAQSPSDRFEAFVQEYQDMVFGTAVRLLGRRHEAEDVAQTVFLKAFQHFDQLAGSATAAGWLRTVTRNVCLNHLTRYRNRWRLFTELRRDDDRDAGDMVDTPAETSSPLDDLERAETARRLEHALRRLPDHQRVPLVLFHFERMSYQDIAQTLGVALAKVKTDMHRGRAALRTVLE